MSSFIKSSHVLNHFSTALKEHGFSSQSPFGSLLRIRQMIVEAIVANNIWNVTDVSSTPYTVVEADFVILVDTSSAAIEVDLPAASEQAGRVLIIKDVSGNAATAGRNITIDPDGSDTIDDMSSVSMRVDFGAIALISGGASNEWHTIMLV